MTKYTLYSEEAEQNTVEAGERAIDIYSLQSRVGRYGRILFRGWLLLIITNVFCT
jgi:hypothetical protein